MNDLLDSKIIKDKCKYDVDIVVFDEIDSTNRYAKELEKDKTIVISDTQSNGRGRLGRDFLSSKGKGIYMSILLKYDEKMLDPTLFTCYTGTVVSKVFEHLLGLNPGIKWVNDIYINNKKVCGILVESVIKNNTFDKFIVGIGINVYKQEFPIELVDKITTLEDNTKIKVSRNEIIASIINEFFDNLNKPFMDYYKDKMILKQKLVEINERDKRYMAEVIDVSDSGELIIKYNGELKKLYTGEVVRVKM